MRLLTILLGLLLSILSVGSGAPTESNARAADQTTKLLLVLQADPADGSTVDPDALNATARTIERRAKGLGIDTPEVWTTGGNQIVVELPGVTGDDAARVTQTLITTALLEIIDTQGAFLPSGTVVTTTLGGPAGGATPEAGTVFQTIVSGGDVKEAYPTANSLGQQVVGFDLTDEAASRFYDFTSSHVGQPMSIVIDKEVISSPVINSAISNQGIIEGIPAADVRDLVVQLNSGPLAVPLRVVSSMVLNSVPPAATPAARLSTPIANGPLVASDCWTADQRRDTPRLQWSAPPAMVIDPAKTYTARVETSLGDFTITFFPQEAPVTVNNFVCLARAGYYDDTTFHRIVAGFVIQGGDPTGTGAGGPGYEFADEPVTRSYELGTVAMANAGPDTNGSQFFVVVGDSGTQLPPQDTIFGQVTKGMDVVDRIAAVPTRAGGSGEKSTPIEPVTIEKITIDET